MTNHEPGETKVIRYLHDGGPFVSTLTIRTGYHVATYAIELLFDDPTDYERIKSEIECRFRRHEIGSGAQGEVTEGVIECSHQRSNG